MGIFIISCKCAGPVTRCTARRTTRSSGSNSRKGGEVLLAGRMPRGPAEPERDCARPGLRRVLMLSLALVRLCEFQVIARQLQESSCGAAIAGSFREAGQGVRLSVVIVIAWHDLSPIYSRDVLNSLQLDSFLKKWHFPR